MARRRIPLFSRLQSAVAKIRFLLSFDLRRWLLPSSSHRRLSFDSRPCSPGLLDITDVADDLGYYLFHTGSPPMRPPSSLSNRGSSASPPLLRPVSPPLLRTSSPPLLRTMSRMASGSSASSDDINQRAEDFIENFYRQLRMERQISLKLRYCNGKGDEQLKSIESSNGY